MDFFLNVPRQTLHEVHGVLVVRVDHRDDVAALDADFFSDDVLQRNHFIKRVDLFELSSEHFGTAFHFDLYSKFNYINGRSSRS